MSHITLFFFRLRCYTVKIINKLGDITISSPPVVGNREKKLSR